MSELEYYEKIKNWDFSMINYTNENNIVNETIEIDDEKLDKYISENNADKGILLIRRYYGITAIK